MHLCPDEIVAAAAVATAGIGTIYHYCRHQIGCFCRWCVRLIRR
jgi:hypothetical protein